MHPSRALRERVSRYMSYLLRHNPENLSMDEYGFVDLSRLLEKLNDRFRVGPRLVLDIVERSEARRFELVDNKIRALYGHTKPTRICLEEDKTVQTLYHGTTLDAARKILRFGLKPMKRERVHLSPTALTAREVGLRRAANPVILKVDAETARREGVKFHKATNRVYVSREIPPRYITMLERLDNRDRLAQRGHRGDGNRRSAKLGAGC